MLVTTQHPNCEPGTKDEYVKAIAYHSQQSSSETLYPGEIYDSLKRFLEQKSSIANNACSNFGWLISPRQPGQQPSSDTQSLSDSNTHRGHSEGFSEPEPCIEALRSNIELSHPQVLFLRGHPTPDWISHIGAFCYTDPELFRWFLRYRAEPGSDCYFDFAPSMMSNILRFKFFTIGSKNYRNRSSQKEVNTFREKAAENFRAYQAELRNSWALRPGESIVRSFHVLDERHCVIEQEIVVSTFDIGKTWMGRPLAELHMSKLLIVLAIAFTDAGHSLPQLPKFPWLWGSTSPLPITLIPTVQYRPRCALKSRSLNEHITGTKNTENVQSLAIFPEGYGRGIDWSLAKSDRFYALSDFFKLAAFSQRQLLNVMRDKITAETNSLSPSSDNPTLANLLYFRDILEDQLRNASYMLQATNDQNQMQQIGRRSSTTLSADQRNVASHLLFEVQHMFEDLHLQAQSLHEKCTQGMTVISNNSMLKESQRAIQQAKLVTKLTLVAFVYLPFTFTAGFFGMNFKELGNGTLHLWIFFAASLPLMFFTMAFFVLDVQTTKKVLRAFHIAYTNEASLAS